MNQPPRFLTLTATCLLASLGGHGAHGVSPLSPTGTTNSQP